MAGSLHATEVGAPDAPRSILMLHGIYGRGRNWQAIARMLVERRPDYRCLLVDLPGHGASAPGQHGPTVAGVAADLSQWLDEHGVRPDAILGHSFGGKVALSLADTRADAPLQIWIIDSTPESGPPSGSAWRMLGSVRALPDRFASREDLISSLAGDGWARPIAQWMATNLDRDGDTFVWRLDFDVMEALIRSFAGTDLWTVVETGDPGRTYHFVKATNSDVLSASAVERLGSAGRPHVELHTLEGSHWIHAERPDAVVDLLAGSLA